MNRTFKNWAIQVVIFAGCVVVYQLLDSRSAADVEQAQADDLVDARIAAQHSYRDCGRFVSPASNPVRSAGAYLGCRDADIEAAPDDAANRYALLEDEQ